MLKKIWTIFSRDIKVNARDTLSFLLLAIPFILAIGINLITPSINDTTVNVAMIKNEDSMQADYFDRFAHVELLEDESAVEERVMRRDDVVGIINEGGESVIIAQGNESESVVEYSKLLNILYESGVQPESAHSEIVEFGRVVPPLKKMMVNVVLLFNAIIAGMLIAMNIVEEKSDNTVSAINVSPVSRSAFIFGKSMLGIVFTLIASIACILITGFYDVSIIQAALVVLATAFLSIIVGFLQGLNSSDVMEASGSVKMMFLPMAGSVVGYELVDPAWQGFFYWSPFYWAYRANDVVFSKSGTWLEVLFYIAIILAICGAVYALLAPRIRKGLEQ